MVMAARVKRNRLHVNPDTAKEVGPGEKMGARPRCCGRRFTQAGGTMWEKLFRPWPGRKKIVKGRAAFYNHNFTILRI